MSRLGEVNNSLQLQVNHLNGQIHNLSGQVDNLQVENARLRALLAPPPPPPSNRVYTSPSDNTLFLPVVVETLAVMRDLFQRQEQCDDWVDIVNRAYREGKIGHKALRPADLNALLFSPVYDA
ncbi:hypothetical protein SLS61_010034 [Didymella pomorum]